ncbi:MAG: putative DNA-binding domain-containing protein [Rhodocyclaceae bacterium]
MPDNLTPPSLRDTLATLQAWVLGNEEKASAATCALLHSRRGVDAAQRLEIYRHAYHARLHESLATTHERTHRLIGEAAFARACDAYVLGHQSSSPNLGDYGAGFADALAVCLDDAAAAEVARIDWLVARAFVAPDADCLDATALATLDAAAWETLRLRPHPAVALIILEWNAVAIWHALDRDMRPPEPARLERPTAHVFWRQALVSRFRSLDETEAALLGGILNGHRFVDVCADTAARVPDLDARLPGLLATWLADGLLSALQ